MAAALFFSSTNFVNILTTSNFVTTIPTVIFTVTLVVLGHAFGITASELRFVTLAVVIFAIFSLIRSVSAIIVMIAFPKFVDTPTVVTSELLVKVTLFQGDIAIGQLGLVLIGTINTVRVSVANPILLDADSSSPITIGLASEFGFWVACSGFALLGFTFIRVVQTIIVTITNVNSRDAIAIVTGEKVPKAGSVFGLASIFGFVFTALTIWITVTIPSGWNASMIRAPERVRGTGPGTAMELIFVRVIAAVIVSIA